MRNEDRRIEGERIRIMGDGKSLSRMEGKEIYRNEFLN
jgi:hypothetical protein